MMLDRNDFCIGGIVVCLCLVLSSRPAFAIELNNEELEAQLDQLREKGQYSKAVVLADSALKQVEKSHGADSPKVGQALYTLSSQYGYLGAEDKQIPLLERAVKILDSAREKHDSLLASCLRSLAFAYEQEERFADSVKALERELAIFKRTGGPDFELEEVQRYLKDLRQKFADFQARKSFPPVSINNVKSSVIPADISRILSDPSKEAEKLIAKGAQKRHEEMGGKAIMLVYQGVQHGFITPDLHKMIIAGHEFKAGDTTFSFDFESEQAKDAFLKIHKLNKTIKLQNRSDKTDCVVYQAEDGVFVRLAVRKSGFMCSTPECKDFMKKSAQEGVCPTCGKRLGFCQYLE